MRKVLLLSGLWALSPLACATSQPKPEVKQAAPLPPPRVVKLREPLEVTPLELHFSGLRGEAKEIEFVSIKNGGTEPAQVSDIRIVGLQPAAFKIKNMPLLPLVLQPEASFSFSVGFEPAADAEPGVHHARVRLIRTEDDDGPPCDLTGLVTKGVQPEDEPSLAQVLDALGYDVDVGSTAMALPSGSAGDQIESAIFQRAKPGNVGYYLMARYSGEESGLFGYYVVEQGKATLRGIGAVGQEQRQTLNPELESESRTSFDPGETPFGLYLKVGKRVYHSDEKLNGGSSKSVARVYPLRSRGRAPVPDAYVAAFDDDGDGDFQDYVFMLWNVKVAP